LVHSPNTIITHLSPEEAIMLIEFLDQVREVLMQTYGDNIKTTLQEATTTVAPASEEREDAPF